MHRKRIERLEYRFLREVERSINAFKKMKDIHLLEMKLFHQEQVEKRKKYDKLIERVRR